MFFYKGNKLKQEFLFSLWQTLTLLADMSVKGGGALVRCKKKKVYFGEKNAPNVLKGKNMQILAFL